MTLYRIDLSAEPVGNANFDGVPGHYVSHLKAWDVLVPVESFEAGFFINDRGVPEILTSDEEILAGGSYIMVRCPGSPDSETTDNQPSSVSVADIERRINALHTQKDGEWGNRV